MRRSVESFRCDPASEDIFVVEVGDPDGRAGHGPVAGDFVWAFGADRKRRLAAGLEDHRTSVRKGGVVARYRHREFVGSRDWVRGADGRTISTMQKPAPIVVAIVPANNQLRPLLRIGVPSVSWLQISRPAVRGNLARANLPLEH